MSVKYFTDSKPELCSQKAIINYGAHFPAGTSYKSLEHYRQIFDKKEFRLYDYGTETKNQHFYGG